MLPIQEHTNESEHSLEIVLCTYLCVRARARIPLCNGGFMDLKKNHALSKKYALV